MQRTVEESGVTIEVPTGKKSHEQQKVYNEKLQLTREAVLCVLTIQSDSSQKIPLECLDAVTNSGLAAMQWKKALKDSVHVVVSEAVDEDLLKSTCDRNNIRLSQLDVNSKRRPGEPPETQGSEEIHVYPHSANIVLHREALDFVYLHPEGLVTSYIDSLFSNIRCNGTACIVSPDLSSLCFRTAHVIQREFHANVIKTEYVRELAVRVLLGAIARSATRCNRGIEVLFVLCTADTFLISVQVKKGSKFAKPCVHLCQQVLHCLICEERVVCPDSNAVIESPYNLLPCDCHSEVPGKTAVVLGPMWVGSMFSVPFLEKMSSVSKEKFPKSKLTSVIETLKEEAKCSSTESVPDSSKESANQTTVAMETCGEPVPKKQKTEAGTHGDDSEPTFYHNLHKKKFKGLTLPKLDKLISELRHRGFRASRTHLQSNAVRTNATSSQILHVIQNKPSENR